MTIFQAIIVVLFVIGIGVLTVLIWIADEQRMSGPHP